MAKTVIVVDDEPDIVKFIRARLIKRGYTVLVAVNGEEGLALMRQQKPDLVLMDKSMPVMDGVEACRRMRADDVLKTVPIMLVTASSPGLSKEEIIEREMFDAYIAKPFEAAKLLEKVQELIGPAV